MWEFGIVAAIVFGIYCLFELFVHRKERLLMIEKSMQGVSFDAPKFIPRFLRGKNFSGLKFGSLLLGIGIGTIVGFFILNTYYPWPNADLYSGDVTWAMRAQRELRIEAMFPIYFASIAVFGALGLIVSFAIERKMHAKERKEGLEF